MLRTWYILLWLMLVGCSAIPANSDSEQSAKDNDNGRPSDETEGVLGYLRMPELVTFTRENFFMTVEGLPGAIVAEDLDVRMLFVHIIQIPIEELNEAKTSYESTQAGGSATSSDQAPADHNMGQAPIDEPAPSDTILPTKDPSNMGAKEDPGPDAPEPPPPQDPSSALTYGLNSFSPSQLIVKGRIRGSLHPQADGSFAMQVGLTRPDPVVLVVGMFDAIELISVKEIADPRVSAIIYSPADTKTSFLDESYISAVDVPEQIEAFTDSENQWKSEAVPYKNAEHGDPSASVDDRIPYLPEEIKDSEDEALDGNWASRCTLGDHGYYTTITLTFGSGSDLLIQQIWAKDKSCTQPFAYVDSRGLYGSALIEGKPYRTMTMAMLYTSVVPLVAQQVEEILPRGTCSTEPWEDGRYQSASYLPKARDQLDACATSVAPLGKLAYINYRVNGKELLLSRFGITDRQQLDDELPMIFEKKSF